jgi:hypothetical protein
MRDSERSIRSSEAERVEVIEEIRFGVVSNINKTGYMLSITATPDDSDFSRDHTS